VVAPLAVEGRYLGAVGARRSRSPLDDDERNVLAAAAAQASVTLENLELQRTRRETLTSYARQVTNAQEDERRRIARELHDGPTQVLSGLCRGLDVLRAQHQRTESAVAATEELRAVAEDAAADLRRITRDLRPTMLDDLGLVSAIEWLASDVAERAGLEIEVTVEGAGSRLTSEQELGVFRIVQEALSNVEKHAQASHVAITIEGESDRLRATVRDDGIGFVAPPDNSMLAVAGRYGLLGMQERARLSMGELRLQTAPGEGTAVTIEVRPAAS
jgi:signal transduction histidine kinase